MTYRLDEFDRAGMLGCTAALRRTGADAATFEDAAEEVVRYLHRHLVDADGRPACPLVRLYKTLPYAELPPPLQRLADDCADSPLEPQTRVLTLMATAGALPAWNDRTESRAHQAIPLPSESAVDRYPMIAQLIAQLGVDVADLVATGPTMVDHDGRDYNVFYVEQAAGSPAIPAQDFVREQGIESAFGFGGLLPRGALYAVVAFSRVRVTRESAQLFRSVALGVNLPLIAAGSLPLFRDR